MKIRKPKDLNRIPGSTGGPSYMSLPRNRMLPAVMPQRSASDVEDELADDVADALQAAADAKIISKTWHFDLRELARSNVSTGDVELMHLERETHLLHLEGNSLFDGNDESDTYNTLTVLGGWVGDDFWFERRTGRVLRASMQSYTVINAGTCDLQIGFATHADVTADGNIDVHDWSNDVVQLDSSNHSVSAYVDPDDGPSGSFEFNDLAAIECRVKKSSDLEWDGYGGGTVVVELLIEVNPCFWLPVREDGLSIIEYTAWMEERFGAGSSVSVYPVYRAAST